MTKRPSTKQFEPFFKYVLHVSPSRSHATMSTNVVSSRFRGLFTARVNFVTPLPDWVYRISGSRVRLPTKIMRLYEPAMPYSLSQMHFTVRGYRPRVSTVWHRYCRNPAFFSGG